MNRFFFSSLLLIGLSLYAQAENWTFFPKGNRNIPLNYGLAVIAGGADLDKYNSSGDLYGLELSFDCLLVKASEHTIRQQVSITKFNKNNTDLYTLELNPHYLYQLESNTYVGVGPSLGLSKVDDNHNDTVGTFGVGASLRKDITEELFLAIEFRRVLSTKSNINNSRFIGKIGYYF